MADLRVTRQAVEVIAADPVPVKLLRVTRHAVEVMAVDPPPQQVLRVTRQVVEVMASDAPYEGTVVSAENALALLQSGERNLVANCSAANGLSLAGIASVNFSVGCSASNALILSAAGTGGLSAIYTVGASSALSLVAQAENSLCKTISASNVLTPSGSAIALAVHAFDVSAVNGLVLSGLAEGRNSTKHAAGQNNLALGVGSHGNRVTQIAATVPIYFTEITLDRVTFDEIEVEHGIFTSADAYIYVDPDPTGNILSFAQRAGVVHVRADGISVSASNALTLSQWSGPTLTGDTISQLVLGQSASAFASKVATSALVLDQQASRTIERFVTASSTLSLHQAVNIVLVEGCISRLYTPFVGSTDDPNTPAPPSTTVPILERIAGMQLYWPVDAPTMTVTLRGPELDNKDRLRFQRINRETRGGTLVVFADPIWPKVQQLTLEFVGLEEDEAQSILSFITATLGKEIGLRDWENRHWTGVVVSPDEPIIRNGQHNISTALEFEGFLVGATAP